MRQKPRGIECGVDRFFFNVVPVMDEVTDLLGLPRLNHELVLFGWQEGAWQKVKSWSVPPHLINRDNDASGHQI